jgi:hypothetical protein
MSAHGSRIVFALFHMCPSAQFDDHLLRIAGGGCSLFSGVIAKCRRFPCHPERFILLPQTYHKPMRSIGFRPVAKLSGGLTITPNEIAARN